MKRLLDPREHARALRQLLWWTLLVVPVGLLAGSASALFLWSLDRVTELRWQNGWLLFLLPVAGLAVGWLYHRLGGAAGGGNNLIIEQIHQPGGGVPRRMAPLILVGTLVTHLFGGSAGREGTAVQMGGSLASAFARVCRLSEENLRVVLLAGVAAGFGSVFGTPLTGAIFAMEVLVIGRMRYDALIPVLVASVVGDWTCTAWGIAHTHYHIGFDSAAVGALHFDALLVTKVVLAAAAFGLVSRLFSELTHTLQQGFQRLVTSPWLRPALGGVLVIGLTFALGTRDYLGLSVRPESPGAVTLLSAFEPGGATPWSWWWKLLFTAVTLSSGFKGGEVTPLFFIGATLGNTLGVALGAPIDLFAGLGFIAVFAGAANTPLACTVMGFELFGAHYGVYFAAACFVAYHFSGHSGIYLSQRIGVAKRGDPALPPDASLREARAFGAERKGLDRSRGSPR
jgi:H+/Cl- antiporter ClcA